MKFLSANSGSSNAFTGMDETKHVVDCLLCLADFATATTLTYTQKRWTERWIDSPNSSSRPSLTLPAPSARFKPSIQRTSATCKATPGASSSSKNPSHLAHTLIGALALATLTVCGMNQGRTGWSQGRSCSSFTGSTIPRICSNWPLSEKVRAARTCLIQR
jgi:hypothetical protein